MIKLGMKIAVIAILVLSAAALVMGILLFQQRETLKGRTQKLEAAIKQVAATIEAGDNSDVKLVIAEDQLKTFKQKPGGPATMDTPLSLMTTAAQNQLARLNGTRTVLAETRTTLAKTEEDLKVTQTNLATAKAEIVTLNETVAAKNGVIESKDVAIKGLEREKGELTAKAEAAKKEAKDLADKNAELAKQTTALEEKIKKMEMQMAKGPDGKPQLAKGQHGNVLYVDPEWNFVIIGIAEESLKNVVPNVEFLIRRSNRLVGKVRVKSVENNMAIADIMSDWQQIPLQKGDSVIN